MDRFKFRAYIQKYNKLVDVFKFGIDMGTCQWVWHSNIYDTLDGKPVLDDWGSVDERFSNIINKTKLSDCILEQCTGLKDKNGNLIYEGDILKPVFSDEMLYEVIWCADCYPTFLAIRKDRYGETSACRTAFDSRLNRYEDAYEPVRVNYWGNQVSEIEEK